MIKTRLVKNKQTWEKFVLSQSEASFLHSWAWGRFQENVGNKIFRFGFFKGSILKGVFLLIKKRARRAVYLVCPGGPLIDWERPVFLEKFINQIKEIGQEENCFFVRVRPQLRDSLANQLLFKSKGFISAPMHLHAENTIQLELKQSEEALLKGMRKNTRYSIKKALKLGVQVVQSDQSEDVKALHRLQLETVKRSHFVPFSEEYFQKEFQAFSRDGKIKIFKSIYKNKVLAAALIIFYGREAVYHYAGSSSQLRQIPASYLLQWEAIKEAKRRGCQVYNFWGVAPLNNSHHRFAGVTLFKKGFGGQRVVYLHAQDLPLSYRYWPVYLFESLRSFYRGL